MSFGASSTVIGAVMTAFPMSATVMRLPIGLLVDRVGRKPFRLAVVGLWIYWKRG